VDAVRFAGSFKEYVAKLNIIPNDSADGVMSGTCLKSAPLVRQILCARVGDVGEMDMSFFPLSCVIGPKNAGEKVEVEPVAALMSSLQAHVNFVCRFLQFLEVKK